jgi:hypothetical protein
MAQGLATLSILALLCSVAQAAATASGGIYRWTDRDGVIHFSDTPPAPGAATSADPDPPALQLDEDTPIPATLNELAPGGGSDLQIAMPVDRDREIAPTLGSDRDREIAPTATMTRSPEELDALDPAWFRGSAADPNALPDMYVDEWGPFTIGEPLEDTRVPPELRCQAARRDLEILRESWPVYRDQGGRLRHQWVRDPYRGVRRYLDDEGRNAALASVQQTLRRDCAKAEDANAQALARTELLRGALCEAERAELAAMESLGGDTPAQSLSNKRALAAEVCGDALPDVQTADTAAPPD